jgi:predicted AlkP superfamily phosphohydrolase/phosphomutase
MARVRRVLVIGLDGATLDLIEPWAQAGHLPIMAELMAKGSYSRLRSVYPVLSSAAWASFMTGMNPGKHGIYDFVTREDDGYSLRPVTRQHMAGRSLWHILSEYGRRVGVVNVPMTYPPEPVNGFLVSGLGTPDYRDFTYPTSLSKRLLQDGYRVNRRVFHQNPGNEQIFLDDTYDVSERLTQATLRLMTEEPWDFFMVVYRDTDEMAHAFWSYMDETHPAYDPVEARPYRDAILDCYCRLDQTIGELIAAAGPETTVLVLSDHGTGPLYKDVFLNEWLRREGFLTTKPPKSIRRTLARLGVTRANVSHTLRTLGLSRVERWIKDLLGERIAALPRDTWGDFAEVIDWPKTIAYSYGYHGQIYINLAGREPEGVVAPGEELERVRARVLKALRHWTDLDDGLPVVTAVYTADELFYGPHVGNAPDLIVVMRDLAYITRHGHEFGYRPDKVFTNPLTRETGGHRLDGVLIASGPGLAQINREAPVASLMDIAPTTLHLLGCPTPEHMDGRVLSERLSSEWRSQPVAAYQDDDWAASRQQEEMLSTQEERELIDRLRSLGYVE